MEKKLVSKKPKNQSKQIKKENSMTKQGRIIYALTTLRLGILKQHVVSWVLEVVPAMPRRLKSLINRYTPFKNYL